MTQPFLDSNDVPVFDTTPFGKAVCAERGDAIGREDPGYLDLNADHMGDWSWKPNRDFRFGKSFQTFSGVPPSQAELLANVRSTPKVQYGRGTEQTQEQFWESTEVSRAKMKRDFLAHLPR